MFVFKEIKYTNNQNLNKLNCQRKNGNERWLNHLNHSVYGLHFKGVRLYETTWQRAKIKSAGRKSIRPSNPFSSCFCSLSS